MESLHKDAVYAILGATGGIGSELATVLAASGAKLALAGRSKEKLEALPNETHACFDATDWEQTEHFLTTTQKKYGQLNGVAHCVGSLLLKPAHITSRAQWDEVLHTNLTSAFGVIRAAAKLMKEGGSVVLVSSAAATRGMPNHEAIAAAKGGIEGLARSSAATYAPRGLRFNVVAPGLTRTPMTEFITSNEASSKVALDMNPMGQLGEPSDIAHAIAWLLDPRQKWVTGQVLGVDGGLSTLSTRAKR
jgi:NAD(P)-dependent dehydrogenase (short-subunit alcohol dehydrogenase family)